MTVHPAAPYCVVSLYRFTPFDDCAAICASLTQACTTAAVKGTILIAPEGINGTIAGSPAAVDRVLRHIRNLPGCADMQICEMRADRLPFDRLKVRVRREIVTMGEPEIDPRTMAGRYVDPQDWNALIAQEGTILIDARNDYEIALGSFAGAINPQTQNFRDFPMWLRTNRDALTEPSGALRIAMFCTGGIRCEKATAYAAALGLDEVYHLKGGILNYLDRVPPDHSLWRGECFVFDQRISLGHGLVPGPASR